MAGFHHQIPAQRIDRVQMGGQGYVFVLTGDTAAIPTWRRTLRVPFTSDTAKLMPVDKNFTAFSRLPQIGFENYIVTGGSRLSSTGAHKKGIFAAYTVGGTFAGAFRHAYVEGVETKHRIIGISSAGALVDTHTGTTLTTTGDTIATSPAPTELTFTATEDGGVVLLEFRPYIPSSGDPGYPYTIRNAYRLVVDFMGSPQVTITKIAHATPFGSSTVTKQVDITSAGSDFHYTVDQSYQISTVIDDLFPCVLGLDAIADLTDIELAFTDTDDVSGTTTGVFEVGPSPPRSIVWDTTQNHALTTSATFTLPGGVSKAFTIRNQVFGQTSNIDLSVDPGTISGIWSWEIALSRVGIIYADASIPILFYVQNKTLSSQDGSGSADAGDPLPDASGTVSFAREVGVLYGDAARVFFTEATASSAMTVDVVASKFGFTSVVLTRLGVSSDYLITTAFAQGMGEGNKPDSGSDTSGPTATDENKTRSMMKQMKWATDLATGNSWGLGYPSLSVMDTAHIGPNAYNGSSSAWANEHRYWVAVKDVDNWLFAVMKIRDINGNTIDPELTIYAGTLNEAGLKQRFIDYLLASDLDLAFTPGLRGYLEAGHFGPYEIKLSAETRLPIL